MPARQRQDHIYKRAYELAASGVHINPITIVSSLVNEGYPEAADLLNSDLVRSDLRDVCTRRWKGVGPANESAPPSEAQASLTASKAAGKRPSGGGQ